jgi:UDPglucose 6-dehydrogenase
MRIALYPPVLASEWNEFRARDLAQVRRLTDIPTVITPRYIYGHEEMLAAGPRYISIGRQAISATMRGSR